MTSPDLVSEDDIARNKPNYQDTFNLVQAALLNPEEEDLDSDDLAALQRSLEIVASRSPSAHLHGVASALHRVSHSTAGHLRELTSF